MTHPHGTAGDGHWSDLPIDPDLVAEAPEPSRRYPTPTRRAQRTIIAVIACAGAVGALARYGMGRLLQSPPGHFPWSTFWTNASGSLVIGFVVVLVNERFPRSQLARPLIATGFLGAYTTFSTYTVDTDLLFRGHDIGTGLLYAFSSLGTGGAAVLAGMLFARFVIQLDHRLSEQVS